MSIKNGDRVRQKAPTITGEVVETKYDNDKNALTHLVAFTGDDGEAHERWFSADELEVLTGDAQKEPERSPPVAGGLRQYTKDGHTDGPLEAPNA